MQRAADARFYYEKRYIMAGSLFFLINATDATTFLIIDIIIDGDEVNQINPQDAAPDILPRMPACVCRRAGYLRRRVRGRCACAHATSFVCPCPVSLSPTAPAQARSQPRHRMLRDLRDGSAMPCTTTTMMVMRG